MLLFRHSNNAKNYYADSIFSSTGGAAITVILIILVLPLVLCFVTGGFYLKQKQVEQQPFVNYKRQLYVELAGVNRSTGLPITIRFSTTPLASPENVRIPVIKSSEFDSDYDGVNDHMETTIRFPLGPYEQIHSVKAAFLFDYKLRTSRGDSDISFLMEPGAVAIIQEQSVLPGDTLMTFGDLKLVQKEIRFLSGVRRTSVFDVSFNDTFSWPDLVSKYFSLNDYVKYDHVSTWTFQPPASQSQGSTFALKTIVNYSTDTVSYVPSVTELVKWIWIQYFCFLVPLAVLIYPATIGFMVTTGVLQSTIKISGKDTAFKDYGF